MAAKIDLTGQTFGRLTVLRKADKDASGRLKLDCECGCPAKSIVAVAPSKLKSGHTRSCGCMAREAKAKRFKDLSGMRFGKLVALRRSDVANSRGLNWYCQCDCGKTETIRSSSLIQGRTKSCGCQGGKKQNLVGQKFGKLTVLKEVGRTDWGNTKWLCQCDCGNEHSTNAGSLKGGSTKSCGCLAIETLQKRVTKHHLTFKVQNQGMTMADAASKTNVTRQFLYAVSGGNRKTRKMFFGIRNKVWGHETPGAPKKIREPNCVFCNNLFPTYKSGRYCSPNCYWQHARGEPTKLEREFAKSQRPLMDAPPLKKERRQNEETLAINELVKR